MKDIYGRGKIKFFRWVNGRQGSGYKIMYFWNWLFDLVLIRYPVGSYINWHVDPVPKGLKHHRINIAIKQSEIGGEFEYGNDISDTGLTKQRFVYFRPDVTMHKVHEIKKGERWILSIGWVTKK